MICLGEICSDSIHVSGSSTHLEEICSDPIPRLWEEKPFVQMFSEQDFLICCQLWEMSAETSDEMKKNGYLWQHFFNI